MKDGWREIFGRHRKKIIVSCILLVLFMFFFGTKSVLYVQFLLGNDIVLELTPMVDEIVIAHGEEKEVQVDVRVTANPFCDITCEEKWIDLATLKVIDEEMMSLYPGVGSTRSVSVKGSGEDERYVLYRYEVACQGEESVLCHTSETPIFREVLVTVHTILNEHEQKRKEELRYSLENKLRALGELESVKLWIRGIVLQVNGTILQGVFDENMQESEGIVGVEKEWIEDAQALWKEQQFSSIESLIGMSTMDSSRQRMNEVQQEINGTVVEYSTFVGKLKEMEQSLHKMQEELPLFNLSVNEKVMVLSERYNMLVKEIENVDFKVSTMLVEVLHSEVSAAGDLVVLEKNKEQREKALELLLNQRVLCEIVGVCGNQSEVQSIVNSSVTVMGRCGEMKKFVVDYKVLELKMKEQVKGVGYARDTEILENVSKYVTNIREMKSEELFLQLQVLNESKLLNEELGKAGKKESVSFAATVNVTPLAVIEMGSVVQECVLPNVTLLMLENVSLMPILLPEMKWQEEKKELGEQMVKCCALGSCMACCVEKGCGEYPILFIHGHAFNADLSAEYSLNAFNELQMKLEEVGYVNAGGVSLYTPTEKGEGTWGLFQTPVSVKGSYYYDTYFTSGGYTFVQQKSERIETYALRLKELIETVQYKTGREKVIIVAHSMGGLVTRRYMQLFGEEDVAKLIMIGTPNKGVVGNVAQYCDIIGEQRECEDMNEKSLFMGKLNAGKKPAIPTFVIVGIGCEMDGKEGDGVVLKENGQLEGAKTTFVKGSCDGLETWHTEMLHKKKVYEAVVEAVKG